MYRLVIDIEIVDLKCLDLYVILFNSNEDRDIY